MSIIFPRKLFPCSAASSPLPCHWLDQVLRDDEHVCGNSVLMAISTEKSQADISVHEKEPCRNATSALTMEYTMWMLNIHKCNKKFSPCKIYTCNVISLPCSLLYALQDLMPLFVSLRCCNIPQCPGLTPNKWNTPWQEPAQNVWNNVNYICLRLLKHI